MIYLQGISQGRIKFPLMMIMRNLIYTFITLLAFCACKPCIEEAGQVNPVRYYDITDFNGRTDSLNILYGENKNLSFNAQVAIIGHELAHASCYRNMNSLQVIRTGVLYFIPRFRAEFEKSTDRRTVEHGLGWQLLEYAEYVRNVVSPGGANQNWMDKFYMSPDEIRVQLSGLEEYRESLESD